MTLVTDVILGLLAEVGGALLTLRLAEGLGLLGLVIGLVTPVLLPSDGFTLEVCVITLLEPLLGLTVTEVLC